MTLQAPKVDEIRSASRMLVRKLGFMGKTLAQTELSPSAVHALIEIGAAPGIPAQALCGLLNLDKSSVSRMLRQLALSGDVEERSDSWDKRVKRLHLTVVGEARLAQIHRFAEQQVTQAMGRLTPREQATTLDGLRLYAGALSPPSEHASPGIAIAAGYRPGLIGRITDMHARHYSRSSGFGQNFESLVASGLAEFAGRLDRPCNAIWYALRDGEIVGSVAIDGEDLGGGFAHLRWFIVEDGLQGAGVGRRLLAAAMAFVDELAFPETHLWTFAGLNAARHLYEAQGFACVEERQGSQWGSEVLEQRFVRMLGANATSRPLAQGATRTPR
ncbi:GNAT family N-acetyltransferase [Rhizobium sp. CRIBSB]|nr:GNAT family N-acetyltransferase [Rhizobium sp. CRIBSB]